MENEWRMKKKISLQAKVRAENKMNNPGPEEQKWMDT